MTYADFNIPAFFFYLFGCFVAFALSLRSSPDNRVLAFVYGAWIAAAFAAHHFVVPHAAELWHYKWYVWNAGVAAFPVLLAYMLKDAGARVWVMGFGVLATLLCIVYAGFSAAGSPLPGHGYFIGATVCETCQVVSMVIWSGPVIPAVVKAWKSVSHRRKTWTQQRVRASV